MRKFFAVETFTDKIDDKIVDSVTILKTTSPLTAKSEAMTAGVVNCERFT